MFDGDYRYLPHGDQYIDVTTAAIVDLNEIARTIQEKMTSDYNENAEHLISMGLKIPLRLVKARNGENYCVLNIKEDHHFTKVFRTDVRFMMKTFNLSLAAKGFIYTFLPYIYFPTNTVVVDGKHPDVEEICEMVGIKKTKYYETIKELKQHNIVHVENLNGKPVLYFNPFLHSCGLVDKDTFKIFENSIFNPEWNMSDGVKEGRT